MAKKQHIDWNKYQDAVQWQQTMSDFITKMQDMTGRELYEMNTLSLVPRYIIDRPVQYALYGTDLNYPVDPIAVMTACLVDGTVYLRVEGPDSIQIDEFISNANWNPITDELEFVERKWLYEDESVNKDMWHIEHYILLPDGTAMFTEYKPIEDDTKPEEYIADFTITLPYFPYVGIPWTSYQSFIDPYKDNIIRQEGAYRVIASENIERMGLQLYITNMRNTDKIEQAPRKFGRRVYMLPKDADFKSPSPDAPGMQLMVEELDRLESSLERASGVVSTEKLASLSGISRMIAERPLIILAADIRDRFTKGMEAVVEKARVLGAGSPDLEASYKPLTHIEDTDKYIKIIDRARSIKAITPEEEVAELRRLLDLSD